jgi:organic hydroperoxide reductase OsmC/OhrA
MKRQSSYVFKNTVSKQGDNPAKTVFSGPGRLDVGPAPEFSGSPETLNPEELFVAAVNNCLMTTFFYFVRKLNLEVLAYYSHAEGRVEKQTDGFRFTNVQVRAEVTVKNQEPAEKIRELGDLAEKYCLVSRSLACPVHYELQTKSIEK